MYMYIYVHMCTNNLYTSALCTGLIIWRQCCQYLTFRKQWFDDIILYPIVTSTYTHMIKNSLIVMMILLLVIFVSKWSDGFKKNKAYWMFRKNPSVLCNLTIVMKSWLHNTLVPSRHKISAYLLQLSRTPTLICSAVWKLN